MKWTLLSTSKAELLKTVGFIGFADKNNINIGQDVWLKKKCDVSFFPEICTRSA